MTHGFLRPYSVTSVTINYVYVVVYFRAGIWDTGGFPFGVLFFYRLFNHYEILHRSPTLCTNSKRLETGKDAFGKRDLTGITLNHDDVIKWKHFSRYWPFVRGIHRSPVNSPHKGKWRGALMSFLCAWINAWVNNRKAADMRRHRAHYDVAVMIYYAIIGQIMACHLFCAKQLSEVIMAYC